MQGGLAGQIISAVSAHGFQIRALQSFVLNRANAEEFLEIYKGVVPDYGDILNEFTSGMLIAFEVCAPQGNSQQAFREFVGPSGWFI